MIFLVKIFLEEPGDLSDCEPETRVEVTVVLDVTDVLVSPSSAVTEFCDSFSVCSDWDLVEPHAFSFSKKRAHSCTVTQERMRFESSQIKAPPQSRRRTTPPTPLQNSYSSFEEEQVHSEVEDQIWSVRDRTVIARTKQYLEESKCEGGSLKSWNPCWVQMIRMWISDESWKKQGTKNVARYLRPSAQMVRVNIGWSAVRDGTSTKGGWMHRGDKTRLLHQVEDSGKRAWKSSGLHGARRKERS